MKKHTFLIVDDIYMNRLLLRKLIAKISNETFEAENGSIAIEILKSKKVDFILMDIEMPVMNGLETTKYIREELSYPLSKIPVIAITAHNPNDFFEDYKDVGFNYILTKPYSLRSIMDTVNKFEF
jgi:CheY-like chemotaxis protein